MGNADNLVRPDLEVAIIGLAGRFPGAHNVEDFWRNLCNGAESISTFSEEQLEALGIPRSTYGNPDFVKAAPVLEGMEEFDAEFFGYTPREAELMDPQHRLFLECAWEALESAGYRPGVDELVGVYAGSSLSSYLLYNLLPLFRDPHCEDNFQLMIGNDKDFLSTRVSYKLNLRGPSITVQTGCSTSLVAVHLACRALLSYECDLALAGGVSVQVPARTGYLYQQGGITSPDGHCRVFDAKAQGTLFGSGVGIVVLKRLKDAMQDRDHIYAVIKGSTINNDGNRKAGYTAPGIAGQVSVIRATHALAEVEPESIAYVECHGTGTALGDPVEIQALTDAFRTSSVARQTCAVGSVKANIGHLDAAAGVAGLIKTVLALKHKLLPPSLHFEAPNPKINFQDSPFFVNSRLAHWQESEWPRRAGVSSFGIGGSNAHMILQEAPLMSRTASSREYKLILLSARTRNALEQQTAELAQYLNVNSEFDLADIAYTSQVGRTVFEHRRSLVCKDKEGAVAALESLDSDKIFSRVQKPASRTVVFMLPGGGSQYVNMGFDLYQSEPVFREELDRCIDLLKPQLGTDLKSHLYPETTGPDSATNAAFFMRQTGIGLPALFAVEYAMAKLWMSWGIRPDALIGHSLGEYLAACLSGVFLLEDALSLVLTRSRLLQKLPKGAMLGVSLSREEVEPLLHENLWLAAVNGPANCVLSGTAEAIAQLEKELIEREVDVRKLQIDVSSHSAIVVPILPLFREALEKLQLHPPKIPFISNVTGTWIKAEQATDPDYWLQHLRSTVLFGEGIAELCKTGDRMLLEVGPGHTLSSLAKGQLAPTSGTDVFSSMRHPYQKKNDVEFLLTTVGKLWASGIVPDWKSFYAGEERSRVPFPTYPFERKQYWIDSRKMLAGELHASGKQFDPSQWFYAPAWKGTPLPPGVAGDSRCCLLFIRDNEPVGQRLFASLVSFCKNVITVVSGTEFHKVSASSYQVNVREPGDYALLFEALREAGQLPDVMVHAWSLNAGSADGDEDRQNGFYSVLFLAQAIVEVDLSCPARLWVVTSGSQIAESPDQGSPDKALLSGICKVIPQEIDSLGCSLIDLGPAETDREAARQIKYVTREIQANASSDSVIAYRKDRRYVQGYEKCALPGSERATAGLREGGIYLITGGLGNIGLALADHLYHAARAKLLLTSLHELPPQREWESWLAEHPEEADSHKISKLLQLQAAGAEILVRHGDVSDPVEMSKVIIEGQQRFGTINGIFHLAGKSGKGVVQLISASTVEQSEEQFRTKLDGARVLQKLFAGCNLDFVMLFSSNASVLGGMGLCSYAAANASLDFFAQTMNGASDTQWISVNWDRWDNGHFKIPATGELDKYAMTMEEGITVMEKIIASAPAGQIVVSTGDLPARMRIWIHAEGQGVNHASVQGSSSVHTRPELGIDYVPPADEMESKIAEIWQEFLGLEKVGRNDNFFDLGGNSLIALKIISRINKELGIKFSVLMFFEGPTISALSRLLVAGDGSSQLYEESRIRGAWRREMHAAQTALS